MKKSTYASLLLTGSMLVSASAFATTSTYQYCTTAGCIAGGSKTVNSAYAQTKYPLVFAHGLGGFSQTAGIDYFYGIPQDLSSNGAQVFVTQVSSLNSSEVRGEQMLAQVKDILAITGAAKVNLIGHSHGVQSVRYVAGLLPTQVASVTGVAGANKGSPLADDLYQITQLPAVGSPFSAVLSGALNAFFTLFNITSGEFYSQDGVAALNSLTVRGATAFNVKFPDGVPTSACGEGAYTANGINYYSWIGSSKVTTGIDPTDWMSAATGLLIAGKSDGIVPQCSGHLGRVIGDNYNMNHFDEVNQVLGMVSIFGANPVTLYRQQANRLKVAGL